MREKEKELRNVWKLRILSRAGTLHFSIMITVAKIHKKREALTTERKGHKESNVKFLRRITRLGKTYQNDEF